jgi:DNA-binding transcriptional MerR regulator
MSDSNKTPAYNLKVVIQETGLKADTLRAWERRYGLPNPQRTAGGHRLYSQYDIEMIKWLMVRQEDGLRINHAIEMWRKYERAGQDPFQEMPIQADSPQTAVSVVITGQVVEEIKQEWVEACLAFDEARAENILAQAFARYPVETVCLEVLTAGLSDIGELWYSGKGSVQQEHFASALAIRRLNALLAAAPTPTRRGRILAACPSGEDHIYPLLLTTLFLRLRGWDVVYLGANVPLEKLDSAMQTAKTGMVISTAQQLISAASLFEAAIFLQREQVPLAYGGLIFNTFPGLQERIPGCFLGESLAKAVQSVEALMLNPPEIGSVPVLPTQYDQAAEHFKEMQPVIAANMWSHFRLNGMQGQHLEVAIRFLGQEIQAGLTLGDLSLLEHEVDWLAGLLQSNDIPLEYLPKYLTQYKQAVDENLDERGQPVKDWLEMMVNEY